MSENLLEEDGVYLTKYCGPERAAIDWYLDKSRTRYQIMDADRRMVDIDISQALALAFALADEFGIRGNMSVHARVKESV